MKSPVLKCVFWDDVLCSFRKSEKFTVMNRCFSCPHYLRFMREMDDEDRRLDDEVLFIQKYGYEAYDKFYKKRKG